MWTAEKIRKIQQIAYETDVTSLNTPIKNADAEPDTEIGDLIPDPSPGLEELAIADSRREMLLRIMRKVLTPKEMYIIVNRFGFDGDTMTLDELGKLYNLTKERVRQIEARALKKIKIKLKQMGLSADNF